MIGGATVEEMQERMSADEFSHWLAWAKIRGPFGEQRADLRNGILCALVQDIWTMYATHKQGKAKATDYMPFYERPEVKPEPDKVAAAKEQIEILQAVLGVPEG